MSAERLFLVNPYDNNHYNELQEFEGRNELSKTYTGFLREIRDTITEEEYNKSKKENNDINEILFIEQNGKIKDSCLITGVKDRKSCKIEFSPLKTKLKNRSLITIATDYVLNSLGMQEAFTILPIENQSMMTMLEPKGYENLGMVENSDTVMYLKEKENVAVVQRTM